MSRSPAPSDMPLQVAPVEEDSCECMTPWPSWKDLDDFLPSLGEVFCELPRYNRPFATARRTLNEDSVPCRSSQRLSPALDVA